MFEVIANFITGLAALTVTFVILTFPTWLAGKIVASQTRALPVPFFFRPKAARWIAWYLAGVTALVAFILATRPTGTFETPTRLILAGIALVAYAAAAISAFYISWTASAQRRARREQARPDHGVPEGLSPELPHRPAPATSEYRDDESDYPPARPREAEVGAEESSLDEYKPARPAD